MSRELGQLPFTPDLLFLDSYSLVAVIRSAVAFFGTHTYSLSELDDRRFSFLIHNVFSLSLLWLQWLSVLFLVDAKKTIFFQTGLFII